jgi:glutaredoxin
VIKVIGKYGCDKCQDVVKLLTKRGIKFSYSYIDELEENIADKYKQKAKDSAKKDEIVYYPILLKNNEVVKLRDII